MEQEKKNSKKNSLLKNALLVCGGAALGILVYNNRAKIGNGMKSAYNGIKNRVGKKNNIEANNVTVEAPVQQEIPVATENVVTDNQPRNNNYNNEDRGFKPQPRYNYNNNKFNN